MSKEELRLMKENMIDSGRDQIEVENILEALQYEDEDIREQSFAFNY